MEPVSLDDPRHQRVLEWITTAPAQREPKTQIALAESLGVSARTVRDWMDRQDFKAAWKARVDSIVGSPERTQRALDRLYDAGMAEGNQNPERQLKLYFEVIKAISPPEVNVNVKGSLSDWTDEQLDAFLREAAEREARTRGISG